MSYPEETPMPNPTGLKGAAMVRAVVTERRQP